MTWADHAIWWHAYPLGACGAPIREVPDEGVVHRLDRLTEQIGHVLRLGANGLLLGPIFASQTHGYDTVDHYRVDPRLGEDADLDRLISRSRDSGVRVVLDGVFNHVGTEHPLFRQACEQGPDSYAAQYFRMSWRDGAPTYDVFEGHGGLVTLNHDSPHVADLMVEVMTHWLSRGIDGWRLDAAYAVPTSFWRDVIGRVRQQFPSAWFLGEVIHGDYAGFVADSGVDTVTQYELWKATWSALLDRNFFELAHALDRHDGFLDSFVPQTFVGNHDVTRIASILGDDRLVTLALVLLMTAPGVPSIYYGDECGLRAVKEDRIGGDDAVRPDLSFLAAVDDSSTMRLHQELIGLRRRHPWVVRGRIHRQALTNESFSYTVTDGTHRLDVELALSPTPHATIRQGDQVIFQR